MILKSLASSPKVMHDGWVGGPNPLAQSVQDFGPFEEAADSALATVEATGAWESGGPGDSSCCYTAHTLYKVLRVP